MEEDNKMSWIEDNGFDCYDEEDIRGLRELELFFDPDSMRLYWITKAGDRIFIEDMETSHIENIIKADLKGKINCTEKTQDRLQLELSIRRGR